MNKPTFLLLAVATTIVTLGAGCSLRDDGKQPSANYSTSSSLPGTPSNTTTFRTEAFTAFVGEVPVFELTFPNTWQADFSSMSALNLGSIGLDKYNYVRWDFGFPEQKDGLFRITRYTKKQWQDIKKEIGPTPEYLGENETHVFTWSQAQEAVNSTMEKRMAEIKDIIKTFTVK